MKKFLLALAMLAGSALAMPAGSRVTLPSGQRIFVSGMNLAWTPNGYASDVIGFDSGTMAKSMKDVHDSGGNCMRIWLSTNGKNDPVFTGGYVSGPNSATLASIRKMLRIAKQNDILVLFSLISHNYMQNSQGNIGNNTTMLTTDSGMNAFCKNYVTPIVTAVGKDPNLLAWEVANEPEGMVTGVGWTDNKISQANVQKFVAKVAAAAHKSCPGILVTNGTVAMAQQSWYTDNALKTAAGGDTAAYLDFYQAHYYGWNGTSNSPFTKNYAAWNLDKPMIIGEYASSDWGPSTASSNPMQDAAKVDSLLTFLDKAGYAGGLGWQYQQDGTDSWMKGFPTFGHSLRLEYKADSNSIKLGAAGTSSFAVSAAATNGGSVTSSVAGRVDSGKADTIKATAATGYSFTGWSGDTAGTSITGATLVIAKVAKDYALQATFTPDAGTNLIKGGTFTSAADQANWELGTYPTPANAATVSYTGGQAAITVTATDTTNFGVQLRQGSIQIDSLATYIVTFDASASSARDIAVTLTTGDWKWQSSSTASLTTTKATYTVELTSNITTAAGLVQFCVGKVLSSVTIDNVAMTRKNSGVAPRVRSGKIASWKVARAGAELSWSRSEAVESASVLRLVDAGGRELSRSSVAAGVRSGSIPAPGSGLAFLVLENDGAREVKAVSPVR